MTTAGPTLGSLFDAGPPQWGLRGDPGLWAELRARFAETSLPATFADLWQALEQAFLDAVGQPLTEAAPRYVARFDAGGMSTGQVHPETWATKLFPLISERYARAMQAPDRPDRADQHRKSH